MDREILFRGKRKDNGEWVEGNLLKLKCDNSYDGYAYYIIPIITNGSWCRNNFALKFISPCFEVDGKTVCQYTGLTDKNGSKIFESDIVKFRHGGEFYENGTYYRNYVVEFINTFVTYGLRLRNKSIHFPFKKATASVHDAEVIGNIFDNPELLNQ